MVHVHIRDGEHRPTLDLGRLTETVAALRESTDLVVQLSTGGSVHDPLDHRLRVLDAAPDSCSLTMGTTNFGDDVFSNPWPFVCELYQLSQERQVVPEFELFDLGHVAALQRLLRPLRPAVRRQGARRLRDGRPGRHARHRRGPGGRRRRAARRRSPAGRPPASAAPPCRSCSPRSPRAATCASAWRTCSRSAGASPVESNAQLVERAVEAGRVAQRTPMSASALPWHPERPADLLGL